MAGDDHLEVQDKYIMYYPDEDKNVEWTIDDDTGFIAPLINLENGMWE